MLILCAKTSPKIAQLHLDAVCPPVLSPSVHSVKCTALWPILSVGQRVMFIDLAVKCVFANSFA